jgi:hypothetical protein
MLMLLNRSRTSSMPQSSFCPGLPRPRSSSSAIHAEAGRSPACGRSVSYAAASLKRICETRVVWRFFATRQLLVTMDNWLRH